MKPSLAALGCSLLGVLLSGCSQTGTSELLGSGPASVQQAQAGQDLSMPPDLQLRPPSEVAAAAPPPVPAKSAKPLMQTASASSVSPVTGAAAAQPQGDIFEQNGISKVHADGTPKTKDELQKELKLVYLAKKRQQNPNYGTIYNIGNVFSGG